MKQVIMHPQAREFLRFVKACFPEFYWKRTVLDAGAGDINGNNRQYFAQCEYHANDVVMAPNVTCVGKTHELEFADATFDTIISTECFEHDMYYKESLQKIVRMLRPGGLFVFTCASTNRPEHGTRRTTPDSYTLCLDANEETNTAWMDYYKNLTAEDVAAVIDLSEFDTYAFFYNHYVYDLYFYGIKKGGEKKYPTYMYLESGVTCTAKTNIT